MHRAHGVVQMHRTRGYASRWARRAMASWSSPLHKSRLIAKRRPFNVAPYVNRRWLGVHNAASTASELEQKTVKRAVRLKDWAKLLKFRLNALVGVTTLGGYVLSGGCIDSTCAFLMAGTMLSASAAACKNQIVERSYDGKMLRTRQRPLVTGRISRKDALRYYYAASLISPALMLSAGLPISALLSTGTQVMYTHMYTPMKRKSRWNTELGAVVGALPPVLGVSGMLGMHSLASPEALALFALLYCWQMQHFMCIAWNRRDDYARAGFIMQSLNDKDAKATLGKGLNYCAALCGFPVLCSSVLQLTSPAFLLLGSLPNFYLLYRYYRLVDRPGSVSEMRATFRFGFAHLLIMFVLLGVCWHDWSQLSIVSQIADFLGVEEVRRYALLGHANLNSREIWSKFGCPGPAYTEYLGHDQADELPPPCTDSLSGHNDIYHTPRESRSSEDNRSSSPTPPADDGEPLPDGYGTLLYHLNQLAFKSQSKAPRQSSEAKFSEFTLRERRRAHENGS